MENNIYNSIANYVIHFKSNFIIMKSLTPTNRVTNSQYDNFTQNANSKIKSSRQEVTKGVVDFLNVVIKPHLMTDE